MKTVTIVGAGFSGLTLAYFLRKQGLGVEVFERSDSAGGLIHTQRTPYGIAEMAAHSLLSDAEVEALFSELKVDFATRRPERSKRYIFWHRPTRWPLSLLTSLKMLPLALGFKRPRTGETVTQWGTRAVDRHFVERLIAPALQGVYAGDADQLSASLVMARMFGKKPRRGRYSGSVAPEHGMGELLVRLAENLKRDGVLIHYGQNYQLRERPTDPVVLCTSAWAAAELVRATRPALAQTLSRCESLPLISVTAFFPRGDNLRGFGCLFPKGENFHALGVLFNDCIFSGRGDLRSETWIFGGGRDPGVMRLSDQQVMANLTSNRRRLCDRDDVPVHAVISRWPRAIPNYSVDWEKALSELCVDRPLFLHGNYLGSVGLSSVLQRSKQLAAELKDLYGE